jgi:hypothetical protein
MLEPTPIGFPVTSSSRDIHDISTPPVTDSSPAFAEETAARDPHNADTPSLVNLFIIFLLVYYCYSYECCENITEKGLKELNNRLIPIFIRNVVFLQQSFL